MLENDFRTQINEAAKKADKLDPPVTEAERARYLRQAIPAYVQSMAYEAKEKNDIKSALKYHMIAGMLETHEIGIRVHGESISIEPEDSNKLNFERKKASEFDDIALALTVHNNTWRYFWFPEKRQYIVRRMRKVTDSLSSLTKALKRDGKFAEYNKVNP